MYPKVPPTAASLHDWPEPVLVDAVRHQYSAHHGPACAEFFARFQPLLEQRAHRMRIPPWEWDTCVTDVLSDAVLRWRRNPETDAPRAIGAYLVRCVHRRYLRLKRDAATRERRAADAAADIDGERVVAPLCSDEARHVSAGPEGEELPALSAALARLADELRERLTDDEHTLLTWLSDGASHREIAGRLGASYDATSKRLWRLCRRLRTEAARRVRAYPEPERAEIARFARRADISL